MSHKKKKNSRNPANNNVQFVNIYDKSPWAEAYFMCGMCGLPIKESRCVTHAKRVHKGTMATLNIVEEDDYIAGVESAIQEEGSTD